MNPLANYGICNKLYDDISKVIVLLNSYTDNVVETRLVGSYAQRTPRPDSDIDIAIFVENSDPSYISHNAFFINNKRISIKYMSHLHSRMKHNEFNLCNKTFRLTYVDWYTGVEVKQDGDVPFVEYRQRISRGEI